MEPQLATPEAPEPVYAAFQAKTNAELSLVRKPMKQDVYEGGELKKATVIPPPFQFVSGVLILEDAGEIAEARALLKHAVFGQHFKEITPSEAEKVRAKAQQPQETNAARREAKAVISEKDAEIAKLQALLDAKEAEAATPTAPVAPEPTPEPAPTLAQAVAQANAPSIPSV